MGFDEEKHPMVVDILKKTTFIEILWVFPGIQLFNLFNGNTFCQITRLIDLPTLLFGDFIG